MNISLANLWVCYLFFFMLAAILWVYVFSYYPYHPVSVALLFSSIIACILTLILSSFLLFESLDMTSSLWFFLLLFLCVGIPIVLLAYAVWTWELPMFFIVNAGGNKIKSR